MDSFVQIISGLPYEVQSILLRRTTCLLKDETSVSGLTKILEFLPYFYPRMEVFVEYCTNITKVLFKLRKYFRISWTTKDDFPFLDILRKMYKLGTRHRLTFEYHSLTVLPIYKELQKLKPKSVSLSGPNYLIEDPLSFTRTSNMTLTTTSYVFSDYSLENVYIKHLNLCSYGVQKCSFSRLPNLEELSFTPIRYERDIYIDKETLESIPKTTKKLSIFDHKLEKDLNFLLPPDLKEFTCVPYDLQYFNFTACTNSLKKLVLWLDDSVISKTPTMLNGLPESLRNLTLLYVNDPSYSKTIELYYPNAPKNLRVKVLNNSKSTTYNQFSIGIEDINIINKTYDQWLLAANNALVILYVDTNTEIEISTVKFTELMVTFPISMIDGVSLVPDCTQRLQKARIRDYLYFITDTNDEKISSSYQIDINDHLNKCKPSW